VEVRELIKLSFGMVSGVGPALMYGMGVNVAQGEGVNFGIFCHHWPNGFIGLIFKTHSTRV